MSLRKKIKRTLIGKAKNPLDSKIFHHLSLIAFFAWVGLGADGLSSSCYGPEEAFLAVGAHPYLSVFVAIASALTVFLISISYSHIIELFPSGGGGYLVASKLLSPTFGMVSGCALLIDYVLTITISVASGADALFSFLPPEWQAGKLGFAVVGVLGLTVLNMRGVKESVLPLVPIFMTFIVTHAAVIGYAIFSHPMGLPELTTHIHADVHAARLELGVLGTLFLILRAYSMGAGTFTGIEAVSNGLPILRDPKVKTGKRTMVYMAVSLAVTVIGLMLAYLLFHVTHQEGKTLNAVLFENVTASWPAFMRSPFIGVALVSEAMLLLIAAQAGFLDGPRVLANMAIDRWFPARFAALSDRLVAQNGILLMGGSALLVMIFTKGKVGYLVVLYSINVFITFCFSQLGMVRHWWQVRKKDRGWFQKMMINGFGLAATSFILISVIVLKFHEGGWITLLMTGALVMFAIAVKRHYRHTLQLLKRLQNLVQSAFTAVPKESVREVPFDENYKTAVVFVNGFNGLGLHTLFNVIRLFGKECRNYVFVEIGIIDAGNFKGSDEIQHLKQQTRKDLERYVDFMRSNGHYAEGLSFIGIDILGEMGRITDEIQQKHPNSIFFGGQLVFPKESAWTRWLHNYTVFSMQRQFYQKGVPFVILPIRI